MKPISLVTFAFFAVTSALPPLPASVEDTNPVALPFAHAVLPVSPGPVSGYDIFKRQGCPNLTLRCPSGACCGYGLDCCGSSCCASGYLCTGGTPSAPCCVAIGALSNTCGASAPGNPCSRPGDVPCNGINICCPPANLCYYDSANIARCSPLAASPTPIQTPIQTPRVIPSPTPYSYPNNLVDTFTSRTTTTTSSTVPRSSSRPVTSTSTSSSESNFWTTGAIVGVSIGSFVGLVLFAFLVSWCCHKSRQRNKDKSPPPGPQYTVPLSDSEISALIRFLDTPDSWQYTYTAEARRARTAPHIDPVSWMSDFANRAVSIRIQQLRGSEHAQKAKTKAGFFGLIPLGKTLDGYFKWSTKRFNKVMFETVGLGDIAAVENLYKQAEKAASSTKTQKLLSGAKWLGKEGAKEWWKHAEDAELLQQELGEFLVSELGVDLATALAEEAVHIKPAIGQGYSVGRAVRNANKKMIKALDWLYPKALEYHLKVFAVNALAEVFPQGANGEYMEEKKSAQVHYTELGL